MSEPKFRVGDPVVIPAYKLPSRRHGTVAEIIHGRCDVYYKVRRRDGLVVDLDGEEIVDAYPEHTKLKAVKDQSQTVGQFLEWLLVTRRHPLFIGSYETGDPVTFPWERLLAEYFGIDEKKLAEEKDLMLEEMRSDGT